MICATVHGQYFNRTIFLSAQYYQPTESNSRSHVWFLFVCVCVCGGGMTPSHIGMTDVIAMYDVYDHDARILPFGQA